MASDATNEQCSEYFKVARAIENGQISVWLDGTDIADFAGCSRGTAPFPTFINHQERLILLLSTGGTVTSLAQQPDTGALAVGVQYRVWQEIVSRDSAVLSQAVTRSLIKSFLVTHLGERPCSVSFSLDIPEARTTKDAVEFAAILRNAG